MDYKALFSPNKTDFTLDALNEQFDFPKKQENYEIEENEANPQEFLEAAAFLAESFKQKDISAINQALLSLQDFSLIDIKEIGEQLIETQFFEIFIELINLTQNTSDLKNDILLSIELEKIADRALMGILLMTQTSNFSIYNLLRLNFLPAFLQNFYEYSRLSQKFRIYSLANIILSMPNETFIALVQSIYQKRKLISFFEPSVNAEDQQKLGYAKLFQIIDKESSESELHSSLFHLLYAICYRLSELTINNEVNEFELAIAKRIFNPENGYIYLCQNQNARRELFRAIFRLCVNSADVDMYIASNDEIISKFCDLFKSYDSTDCELVLCLFSLLSEKSDSAEIHQYLVSKIPWKSLLLRLRNHELEWHSLFFMLVDQYSQPDTIEILFKSEVFSDLLEGFLDFNNNTRVHNMLQMFVKIIERVPPEICLEFVQLGIINLLFDLIEYDDLDVKNTILDTLHNINTEMMAIDQIPFLLEKYEENDAMSSFEDVDSELQPKVQEILTELGITPDSGS